eukprot:Opistho-2@69597
MSQQFLKKPGSVGAFVLCVGGIYVFYLWYGILQEKITQNEYGLLRERFRYTMAIVFVQCVINALCGLAVWKITRQPENSTPILKFAFSAFTYIAAMITSNHALTYIDYPTQVLAKSCKPMPVLLLGVLINRRRYSLAKYLSVVMLSLGIALFMWKEHSGPSNSEHPHFGYGLFLLAVSLLCDGLTGPQQEQMMENYNTTAHQMMYYINACAGLMLFLFMAVSGEIGDAYAFVQRNPDIIEDATTLSLVGALGQNFIFLTVEKFGPLTCSVVTTTRKFFTILASVIVFGHVLSTRQWSGVALVFLGLSVDTFFGKKKAAKHADPHHEKQE